MDRFILRYRGQGSMPPEDVERIQSSPRVKVIDRSPGRMLLVEAPEAELKALIGSDDDWLVSREHTIRLPKPHPNLAAAEPKKPR
jgi:hypothetical protein